MLSAQDIAALRKEGFTDDEILTTLRGKDKTFDSDLDTFKTEGFKAGEVLDTYVSKWKPVDQAKPGSEDGILTSTLKSAGQGVGSVLSGYGKTLDVGAEEGGYRKVAATVLKKAGETIAPDKKNFTPATESIQWNKPSTWTAAPRALIEMAPGLVTDLAAGAVGTAVAGPGGSVAGFLGNNALRNFGNNVEDRMGYQGKGMKDASTGDLVAAGAGTVAEGALSRIGLGPALAPVAGSAGRLLAGTAVAGLEGTGKQVAKQMGKAAATEAITSVPGNIANQIGRTIGTDKGISIDANEALNEGFLGGISGGAVRGARGVGEAAQTKKLKNAGLGADPEADAKAFSEINRAADTGKDGQPDLSTPKASFNAVKGADIRLAQELDAATKNASRFLSKDVEPETASRIETILKRVKSDDTLTKPDRDLATKTLSNDADGAALLNAIRAQSSLNAIKRIGSTTNGEIKGGLAQTGLVKGIDQRAPLAAVGGLLAGSPYGMAAAAAAPVAGLIDRVTGARNPIQSVTNRMANNGVEAPTVDPNMPSRRKADADAKSARRSGGGSSGDMQAAFAQAQAMALADRMSRGGAPAPQKSPAPAQAPEPVLAIPGDGLTSPPAIAVPPAPANAPIAPKMADVQPRPVEGPSDLIGTFPDSQLTDRGTLRASNEPVDRTAADAREANAAEIKGQKFDGDTFTHDGLTFPIPPDVKQRGLYVNEARHLQNRINVYLSRAMRDGEIEPATFNAIEGARTPLKMARTVEDAMDVVSGLKQSADSADRTHIDKVFDKIFFDQWKKVTALESRYTDRP